MNVAGAGNGQQLRLFMGLSLTDEVREFVCAIAAALKEQVEGVRWVPSRNLHVTLKFLGPCDESRVEKLVEVMGAAAAHLPLTLVVGQVGAFPSLASARVVWVGASDLEGRVQKVYNVLDRGAARCGIPREKRPYTPHITVGRARKKPARIEPSLACGFCAETTLEVRDIVLFESVLDRTGAEYKVLEKVGKPAVG
jgi:RNA 2',3'-cyclic 3'-phosphodiesterase